MMIVPDPAAGSPAGTDTSHRQTDTLEHAPDLIDHLYQSQNKIAQIED